MNFRLLFTTEARDQLNELIGDPSRLKTHKYDALQGPEHQDIFEAYAENMTPGAYRVFWHYGPAKEQSTIYAITPHP